MASPDVLTCLFDFKNPYCHLALPATEKLIDELGIEVDWQPLLVAPLQLPAPPAEEFDRGTSHRWQRAQYFERDLQRYAQALEIPASKFSDGGLYRPATGAIAASGFLWLKTVAPDLLPQFLKVVFAAYWDGDLSVDSAADVSDVLRSLDLASEVFQEYLDTSATIDLDAQQAALRERGYFAVPGYVVAGEIYYGRQQLPMVRWQLAGCVGQPPI